MAMNAKQFIIDVYERHAKAVENGYDLRMEESEWLEIMEKYADHKLDMARKNSGNFTNGSFTLAWEDLWKSKMMQRAGYKKGTFITDTNKIADIISNGAQIEMKAQEVRDLKGSQVQVIECRIYFI